MIRKSHETENFHFLHLINTCQLISASLDQGKIFEAIASFFDHELAASGSAIFSFDGKQVIKKPRNSFLRHPLRESPTFTRVFKEMVEQGQFYQFIRPVRGASSPLLFVFRFQCAGPSSYFYVGVMGRKSTVQHIDQDSFENRIRLLKSQIELSGTQIERLKGVHQLVFQDEVTGLFNSRYLSHVLDLEIRNYRVTQRGFSVLFMDVDQFKSINERYGHQVGNGVLQKLGSHLKKFFREKDFLFRYGGDEFVAVLSGCDLPAARRVAERVRRSVAEKKFKFGRGQTVGVTVTIGIAQFPKHAQSKSEIIEKADEALYQGKRCFKNCIQTLS